MRKLLTCMICISVLFLSSTMFAAAKAKAPAVKNVPGQFKADTYDAQKGTQIQATTDTDGGKNVCRLDAGTWLEYKVKVAKTEPYILEYRYSADQMEGQIDFLLDGTNLTTTTLPVTGGLWMVWDNAQGGVTLPEGNHTIKLAVKKPGFILNWVKLTPGVYVAPTPPPAVSGPLSQGKPITASSFEVVNPATNANDGKMDTRWAAGSAKFPQWWQVDLGSAYDLGKVEITWFKNDARAYKYKIEISSDGNSFDTVVDKTKNEKKGVTTDVISGKGRYVKVTVVGTSDGWASAYEIKVFGK